MLIECCEPGTSLCELLEPDQDVIIARLLRRLWRMPPSPHPFRSLSEMLGSWTEETTADAGLRSDPGFVRAEAVTVR